MIHVVGCVVAAEDGRVLLGEHLGDGRWMTPGGKVEHGEALVAAVRRELFEETSLSIPRGIVPQLLGHFDDGDIRIHFFVVRGWQGFPRLMEPHKCGSWAWVEALMPPENSSPGTKWALARLSQSLSAA